MKGKGILIVEDETALAGLLKIQLEEAGFRVDIAPDGYIGKQLVTNQRYDLVILDLNLPLINGYDLCGEIRKVNWGVPIIMLTALGTLENKLYGFKAGADDYLTKPFEYKELLARINVLLKRISPKDPDTFLKINNLSIDNTNKVVVRGGKRIDLTSKEFVLLEFLVRNKGQLLSRENIMKNVWDMDFDPGTNIIDVYINYLRKKIDRNFEPKLIHTKFGFGFYCNETAL